MRRTAQRSRPSRSFIHALERGTRVNTDLTDNRVTTGAVVPVSGRT